MACCVALIYDTVLAFNDKNNRASHLRQPGVDWKDGRSPMQIAMVFDGLGYGGIERVGLTYAKMMLNLGHELIIYNLNPSQYELEGEFPNNCEIKHVSLPWLFLPNWFFPMTKRWWWGKFVYPIVYVLSKLCLVVYALLYRIAHIKSNYDVAIFVTYLLSTTDLSVPQKL